MTNLELICIVQPRSADAGEQQSPVEEPHPLPLASSLLERSPQARLVLYPCKTQSKAMPATFHMGDMFAWPHHADQPEIETWLDRSFGAWFIHKTSDETAGKNWRDQGCPLKLLQQLPPP